jgi:hypothetical protein
MNEKTKKFLKELKDSGKWNDECDYSKVEYVKKNEKVIVISKKFNTIHLLTPQALLEGRPLGSINLKDGVLPFEEARKIVRGLKLKDTYDWKKYYSSGLRPYNIPTAPDSAYKNSGWISLYDWLIGEPIDDVIIQELKEQINIFSQQFKNLLEQKYTMQQELQNYNDQLNSLNKLIFERENEEFKLREELKKYISLNQDRQNNCLYLFLKV